MKPTEPGIISSPLVSVAVTAFNLEKWLARALDSILKQRTDFPFEIVIGEDCSTDSTREIALSYKTKYPDIVRVIERSTNLGMAPNYYDTFNNCRGKYIAWLDADDYWTADDKLAVQVTHMEADPGISVCCHRIRWVSPEGKVERESYPSLPAGRYGLAELVRHNFVPSPSILFRNGIQQDLPTWYFDMRATEWPILILAAQNGDILLLDRIMADYMLTPNSWFMSQGDLFWYTEDARLYEKLESVLPSNWHRVARSEKGKRYESIAYLLRKKGDFVGSRTAAINAFSSPALRDNCGSKTKSLLAALLREIKWRFQGSPAANRG